MIEAKYILTLCDRFEPYLVPLDIFVLRQRYNGQTLKSTYAVARDMGISDETVRTIENRALDALAHCLDLEANDQDITPMRLAKSFRQPMAIMICEWSTTTVTAAAYTAHRGELIIVASSLNPGPWAQPLPLGAIIGRCLLVECYRGPLPHPHPHQWQLSLERPEAFPEPIPYSGHPGYFYINNEVAKQLPSRYKFSYSA